MALLRLRVDLDAEIVSHLDTQILQIDIFT